MSMNEDAALYTALFESADTVFGICAVEDFTDGNYRELAELIVRTRATTDQANLKEAVVSAAQRVGRPAPGFVLNVVTCGITGTAEYWARRVRDDALRVRFQGVLSRGLQRAKQAGDVGDAIAGFAADFAEITVPVEEHDDTWSLDDLMGLSFDQRRFTVPGLLARSERLVLTGREGGGKSLLVYQLLTSVAFGVNPLTMDHCEPQRVMLVDVENSSYQQRDNLDRVVPLLRELRPDVRPEWASLKRRVVNLLATRDKNDLIRSVTRFAPDVLYMGTAYRLTDDTDDVHRTARAIQSTVDAIRAELDCSVVVEHHSGHGTANDRNGGRPEGSSFWLRWPDFGKAMLPRQLPNDHRRFMVLGSWRGNRTARDWPVAFVQGNVMPWSPVMSDEYEAVYQPILGDIPTA